MRIVTNLVIAGTLLSELTSLSVFAQSVDFIDLTKVEAKYSNVGLIGGKGGVETKKVELPLEVSIVRIWPLSVTWRDKIEVDITVKNLGRDSIAIPISKDHDGIYKNENRGIKTAHFRLRLTLSEANRPDASVDDSLDSTHGSASVPGSMLLLPPNGIITFRVARDLSQAGNAWRERALVNLRAQAVYWETYIDETDLIMYNSSREIVSSNSVDITIAWPRR